MNLFPAPWPLWGSPTCILEDSPGLVLLKLLEVAIDARSSIRFPKDPTWSNQNETRDFYPCWAHNEQNHWLKSARFTDLEFLPWYPVLEVSVWRWPWRWTFYKWNPVKSPILMCESFWIPQESGVPQKSSISRPSCVLRCTKRSSRGRRVTTPPPRGKKSNLARPSNCGAFQTQNRWIHLDSWPTPNICTVYIVYNDV